MPQISPLSWFFIPFMFFVIFFLLVVCFWWLNKNFFFFLEYSNASVSVSEFIWKW